MERRVKVPVEKTVDPEEHDRLSQVVAPKEVQRVGWMTPVEVGAFYPTTDQVINMGIQGLRTHRLSKIRYSGTGCITRLTFGFSDGSISPPPDSYDGKVPDLELGLGKGDISRVVFGLNETPSLIALSLFGHNS